MCPPPTSSRSCACVAHAVAVHGGSTAERIDTAHRYLAALLEGLRTPPHGL
ncbi:hypothetical protein ACIQCR_33090 [Streptomyces sp. NPDC093249]|uniref:hypothetical protein n=1 Tax=unclassified Streptomyces TaxID=2593676 RepID=UPI00344C42DB